MDIEAAMRKSSRVAMLDVESERTLIRRWQQEGDRRALDRLIRAHLRLSIRFAQKYRTHRILFEDLVQEANIGMMKAADRFDLERDVRFATYAAWWIRSAIQDYLKRQTRDRSVSAPPLPDEGGERDWFDCIADDAPCAEGRVQAARDHDRARDVIISAMRGLRERERRIIVARHVCDEKSTLDALGVEMGVSKERIRQIEAGALDRLRTRIRKQDPEVVEAIL